MAGPSVQMPTVFSQVTTGGVVMPEWAGFFSALQQIAYNGTRSGAGDERPTEDTVNRWIGMPYFDTDLGKPIWLKSVDPDVWVDATGAVV